MALLAMFIAGAMVGGGAALFGQFRGTAPPKGTGAYLSALSGQSRDKPPNACD
jgi:hypothetical protein